MLARSAVVGGGNLLSDQWMKSGGGKVGGLKREGNGGAQAQSGNRDGISLFPSTVRKRTNATVGGKTRGTQRSWGCQN